MAFFLSSDVEYNSIKLRAVASKTFPSDSICPVARLLDTAQVHQGDVLLIDWHPGENGVTFLCDTKSRFSNSPIVPPGGNTGQLRAAKVPIS
jgi:hypothetical protein